MKIVINYVPELMSSLETTYFVLINSQYNNTLFYLQPVNRPYPPPPPLLSLTNERAEQRPMSERMLPRHTAYVDHKTANETEQLIKRNYNRLHITTNRTIRRTDLDYKTTNEADNLMKGSYDRHTWQ
jgi:hypothetical protein